ncbi:superinfection exclusion B family protein [Bacillus altitudinis]|uniref:superinfection exclusion B family protein n=1 Tax=Bacillus altitudinis TaxID=293387 RepID=UPI0011A18D4C|nr:superinfection exclusion B family protein [Bacillus altitudinis]
MSTEKESKSASWVNDIIKMSPKYLIAFMLFSGVSLLLGNSQLGISLGLKESIDEYKVYLGIVFLASSCFLISHFIHWLYSIFKFKIDNKVRNKEMINRLKNLNDYEKQILRAFIFDNQRSVQLQINDGTVAELVLLRILFRSTSISNRGMTFSYNLNPVARDYLTKNQNLLSDPIERAF